MRKPLPQTVRRPAIAPAGQASCCMRQIGQVRMGPRPGGVKLTGPRVYRPKLSR